MHTPPERFEEYMKYLHDERFKAIAVRDLAKYVDWRQKPDDPWMIIEQRKSTAAPARALNEGILATANAFKYSSVADSLRNEVASLMPASWSQIGSRLQRMGFGARREPLAGVGSQFYRTSGLVCSS